MKKRKVKKYLKLLENMEMKGTIILPKEEPKGAFEVLFGEIGKLLDVIIDVIMTYINNISIDEWENLVWLVENQKYWDL